MGNYIGPSQEDRLQFKMEIGYWCWWADGPSLGRLDEINKLPDEELSCLDAFSTENISKVQLET